METQKKASVYKSPFESLGSGRYGVKNWQKFLDFNDWNSNDWEYMKTNTGTYPVLNMLNNVNVVTKWSPSPELILQLDSNNISKDEYFDLRQKLGRIPTNDDYLLYNTFKALKSNGVRRTPEDAATMVSQSNLIKSDVIKAKNDAAPYVAGALSIPLMLGGAGELAVAVSEAAPAIGEFFTSLPGLLTSAETQSAVNNMIGWGLATSAGNEAVKTFSNGKMRSMGNFADQLFLNGGFESTYGPLVTDLMGDLLFYSGANNAYNYTKPYLKNAVNASIDYYNNNLSRYALKAYSKVRYPGKDVYYHGSPTDFNLDEAYMGTPNDMGLHASKDYESALTFTDRMNAGDGSQGVVKAFAADLPQADAVWDLHSNGIEHLERSRVMPSKSANFSEEPVQWEVNMDDPSVLKMILTFKSEGTPYNIYPQLKNPLFNGNDNASVVTFDKDYTIHPRESLTKGLSPEQKIQFDKEADDLLEQYYKAVEDLDMPKPGSPESETYFYRDSEAYNKMKSEFNTKSAELLHKYGIDVVKYYNNQWTEGAMPAYWFLDPKAMKELPSFKLPYWKKNGGTLNKIYI